MCNDNKRIEPTKYTGKFQEGNVVKVTAILADDEYEYLDKIGTVESVRPDFDFSYKVAFEESGNSNIFNEACLTLVHGATETTKGVMLTRDEIKVITEALMLHEESVAMKCESIISKMIDYEREKKRAVRHK